MKRDRAKPLNIPATIGSANANGALATSAGDGAKALGFEKWLLRKLLNTAGNPPFSIRLWNGEKINPSGMEPKAQVTIADRNALLKLCLNPDLQLGELYTEGRIGIDGDLEIFIESLSQALPEYEQRGRWSRLLAQLYLLKRNTQNRAKDNIYHHYDLGHEFYQLWLDQQMV